MSKAKSVVDRTSEIKAVRKFKIIAVNFVGRDLEAVGMQLAKSIEIGQNKKVLQVIVKDPGVEDISSSETQKLLLQIDVGIEKCKKAFEISQKLIKTEFEEELKKFWMEGPPKPTLTPTPTRLSTEELTSDEEDEVPQSLEIIPQKLNDLNRQLLFAEIEKSTLSTPAFFIVLLGTLSLNLLSLLIMSTRPFAAIIHFIPCPEADLKVNFPEQYNDIYFLRKYSDTKNVGVFVETITPPEVGMEQEYSQKIYDQFIWYLYDIEMFAQQFIAYETDFVEINDTFSLTEEQLGLWSVPGQTAGICSDDTAVALYMDNLFTAIEGQSLRMKSYTCRRPFLENSFGKVVIEDANEVLHAAIATRMNVMSYWRVVELLLHGINDDDSFGAQSFDVQLPCYYELLSWEAFVQMLEAKTNVYDNCARVGLTDGCSLYILRRTFNKIIDVEKKYRLATKLGYRDFCQFVAPDLADIIRYYKSQEEAESTQSLDIDIEGSYNKNLTPRFSGVSFDDSLQELYVSDKMYRFEDGFIHCSMENWRFKERLLSVEIRLFDCTVLTHRCERFISRPPRVRIVTRNNIACNISIQEDFELTNISIHWPNDCQIQYLNENGAQAIEQRCQGLKRQEHKRLYTSQGCVLIFRQRSQIEILTPNGIIYMLFPADYIDDDIEMKSYVFIPTPNIDVTNEVAFVEELSRYDIECCRFDVTRADGKKLKVLNGEAVEELASYLVYEWTDLIKNEWYAVRDDGVQMIWTSDYYKCFYTCGTVITTTVVENVVEVRFGCRSASTEKILQKINPTLVEKVANKANKLDTFVGYNANYLMQHKSYASVASFHDDRMVIHSPDDLRVTIARQKNTAHIDIGETLAFRVTEGLCTIVSGKSVPEEKSFSLSLSLSPEEDSVISFRNKNAFVTLESNGEMNLIDGQTPLEPYMEEMYFLSKRRKFGLAFFSDKAYHDTTTNFKDKVYVYNSPTRTVIFKPIVPFDEMYSMPIPDIQAYLMKFKITCDKHKQKKKQMERVLSAKTILKLNKNPDDASRFVYTFPFTEKTLGDIIEQALDDLLIPKTKPKFSLEWKSKIECTKNELDIQRQRSVIYHSILRRRTFPIYPEFKKCNKNFRFADIDKLVSILK